MVTAVLAQDGPRTRASLAADLTRLGLATGDTVLVHASLRSLGYVCGGATAVVQALLDAIGPDGTLVAAAQTPNNRDPSRWTDPPIPAQFWPTVREHLPGFDPELTPSEAVGQIAERVRTWPGAVRSTHPQTSFAAIGPQADRLMRGHRLESQLGEHSPLARLEEADARILLIGVGFARTTAFHLAEYRLPDPPQLVNGCAVMTPDGRRWITYTGVALDQSDFDRLGADFERDTDGAVRHGRVGSAACRLLRMRDAVGYAEHWMRLNRSAHVDVPVPTSSGELNNDY